MIPKTIHYCWFGKKELPELAQRCIKSWRKFFPDYEIREWNEENFSIAPRCDYVREAYQAKKWAFVSDYARFWILYHYGGLYFDTDVEVIKSFEGVVEGGAFMGSEPCPADEVKRGKTAHKCAPGLGLGVNPGLGLGVNPGLGLYKEILDFYDTLHFIRPDGSYNMKTVVEYTTEIVRRHGFRGDGRIEEIAGVTIYPPEYFCPVNYRTGKMTITDRTFSIHHYSASWQSPYARFKTVVKKILGEEMTEKIMEVKRKIKKWKQENGGL